MGIFRDRNTPEPLKGWIVACALFVLVAVSAAATVSPAVIAVTIWLWDLFRALPD